MCSRDTDESLKQLRAGVVQMRGEGGSEQRRDMR